MSPRSVGLGRKAAVQKTPLQKALVRKGMALLGMVGSLLGLLGGLLVQAPLALAAATPISGGGSSFAALEMGQWVSDESGPPANLSVNYASTSSQIGRSLYAAGTYQYGASDIIYYSVDGAIANTVKTQHPFNYVTVSAGGLAFMYNVVVNGTRFTGLNLTSKEVCQIFTGGITNWNQLASTPGDAALAAVNHPIQVVARQDGAGESYVLSQYCLAVDGGDWATFRNYVEGNTTAEESRGWAGDPGLGAGTPVEFWPTILEGNHSALMAGNALDEESDVASPNQGGFSIGYMAAGYASNAGFPVASVQNSAGRFAQPDANSVQIALSYASLNSLGTFDLNFAGPSPQAYFPSTYSYVLAPTTTNAPTSAGADATLAQFLCYAVGAGQNRAVKLGYAPLSQQVTQLSVNAIESIPGARGVPNCGVGGPEPQILAPGQVVNNPAPPPPTTAPATGPAGTPGSATATTAPPTATATTAPGSAVAAGGAATTVAGAAVGPNAGGGNAATGSGVAGTVTTLPCVSTTTTTRAVPKTGASTTTLGRRGATTTTGSTTTTLGKRASKASGSKARGSETVTPGKASTPTKSAASTTTTAHNAGSTSVTASTTSTTSTTLCSGSAAKGLSGAASARTAGGSGATYGPGGALLSGGASSSPTTVQLAAAPTSSSNATNSQAYWYLLVGALICAVGVAAVEFRRRPAQ